MIPLWWFEFAVARVVVGTGKLAGGGRKKGKHWKGKGTKPKPTKMNSPTEDRGRTTRRSRKFTSL